MNRRSAGNGWRRPGLRYIGGDGTEGVSKPPLFGDIALWLDLTSPDTSIVSGAVAQLGDRSGNAYHFANATDTKRPTYTASDVDFGGQPSMTLDGVDDFLASVGTFALGASGACTIYAIAKTPTGFTGVVFGAAGAVDGAAQLYRSNNDMLSRYSMLGAYAQRTEPVANVTARLAYTIDGNTVGNLVPTAFVDGVKDVGAITTSGVVSAFGLVSTTYRVGSPNGTAAFLNGKIGRDLIVYDGAHTDAQVATVDAWLAARYA